MAKPLASAVVYNVTEMHGYTAFGIKSRRVD